AVREGVLGYTRKLEALPDSQTDVIGYAFAVNGEINSADVYASAALFRQLWPRLLASAAAEALAEREAETAVGPVRVSALRRCLVQPQAGVVSLRPVLDGIDLVIHDTDASLLFESRD